MPRRDPVPAAKAVILKVLEQESDPRKMEREEYRDLLEDLIEELQLRLQIYKTENKTEG